MTTRGSYVHKPMVKIFGGISKTLHFLQFSQTLMVSDKTIHKALRIDKTLKTIPIAEFFYFHYLPKLYIGFKQFKHAYINQSYSTWNPGSRSLSLEFTY